VVLSVAAVVGLVTALSFGCTGSSEPPCNGTCTSSQLCVEVGDVSCAPKCSQDAGTAETDAGKCLPGTTCQEAVTMYCDQPCQVSTADVCL
jgi:hypothetical protein